MNPQFPHASESFKRINPSLYGGVGGLQTNQPESIASQTLDSGGKEHKEGQGRVAISFIVFRRRKLDPDNNVASLKGLVDAVCESIGIDDGSERLDLQFHQIISNTKPGVAVKIETL